MFGRFQLLLHVLGVLLGNFETSGSLSIWLNTPATSGKVDDSKFHYPIFLNLTRPITFDPVFWSFKGLRSPLEMTLINRDAPRRVLVHFRTCEGCLIRACFKVCSVRLPKKQDGKKNFLNEMFAGDRLKEVREDAVFFFGVRAAK